VLPAEHWPHAPEGWQAGAPTGHSASLVHARQVCVAPLHTGVVPPHCAFDVHGTHTPGPRSQAGVAAPHFVRFVAEHWPHAPDGWQAGVAPPHSPSPPQARQTCVAASHTGDVPPHCAFDVHETQTPEGV